MKQKMPSGYDMIVVSRVQLRKLSKMETVSLLLLARLRTTRSANPRRPPNLKFENQEKGKGDPRTYVGESQFKAHDSTLILRLRIMCVLLAIVELLNHNILP